MTGTDLLDQARHLHPHAGRGLLIDCAPSVIGDGRYDLQRDRSWPDRQLCRQAVVAADKLFHSVISNLLLEWAEAQRSYPFSVHVVGESWSGRAYELRQILGRCALPHTFSLADSYAGQALVVAAGREPTAPPHDDAQRQDPAESENAEIAIAAGSPVTPEQTDSTW